MCINGVVCIKEKIYLAKPLLMHQKPQSCFFFFATVPQLIKNDNQNHSNLKSSIVEKFSILKVFVPNGAIKMQSPLALLS